MIPEGSPVTSSLNQPNQYTQEINLKHFHSITIFILVVVLLLLLKNLTTLTCNYKFDIDVNMLESIILFKVMD